MKKLLKVIVVILLCIGFSGCAFNQDKNYDEYNKRLKELRKEKEALEKEYSDLKQLLADSKNSSTIVLLADSSKNHLNDSIRIVDAYQKNAVLALEKMHDPRNNEDNYLNDIEVRGLLDKGYDLALKANKYSDIKDLVEYFSDYEFKAVYFPESDYTDKQIEDIKELNIGIVISYSNNIEDDDIIVINSIGALDEQSKSSYKSIIASKMNAAMNVGYSNGKELFDGKNFENMIKTIKKDENDGLTIFTDLDGVIKNSEETVEENSDILERMEEIQIELEVVSKELITK